VDGLSILWDFKMSRLPLVVVFLAASILLFIISINHNSMDARIFSAITLFAALVAAFKKDKE
jgi:hypothetical protein